MYIQLTLMQILLYGKKLGSQISLFAVYSILEPVIKFGGDTIKERTLTFGGTSAFQNSRNKWFSKLELPLRTLSGSNDMN
jgi:hypothetical protein